MPSRLTGLFRAASPLALAGVPPRCFNLSRPPPPGPPVANRTLEPELADRVTRGLEEGFRARTSLRRVNEGGDAELVCTLTDYSHRPQTTAGDRVTSYR